MRECAVGEPLIAGFAEVDLDLVLPEGSDAPLDYGFIGIAFRTVGALLVKILEYGDQGLFLGHVNGEIEFGYFNLPLEFGKPSAGVTPRIWYTQCTLIEFIITCVHVSLNYLNIFYRSPGNLNTDHPSRLEMKWRSTTRIWYTKCGGCHLDSVWGQWAKLRDFVEDFYGIWEVRVVLVNKKGYVRCF